MTLEFMKNYFSLRSSSIKGDSANIAIFKMGDNLLVIPIGCDRPIDEESVFLVPPEFDVVDLKWSKQKIPKKSLNSRDIKGCFKGTETC